MLRYMKALAKVIVKNPVLWVVTLLCAFVIALSAIKGDRIFAGEYLGRESFARDQLNVMQTNMAAADHDNVPEEIQERWREEISLMSHAVSAKDDREYFEIRAELAEREAAQTRAGTMVGMSAEEHDSRALFFRRMAALENPVLYDNCAEASATWYLSYQATQPLILWLLPTLVIAASAVGAARGKRLLVQAPVARGAQVVGQLLLLIVLSFALLLVMCLPSFVLQTIRVGVGDLSYPVVHLMAGQQFDETVALVLARELAAYVTVSFLMISVSIAGSCILRGRMANLGTLLASAMCAAPLISAYMQLGSADFAGSADATLGDPLAPFSAFTYLEVIARAAGWVDYWPNQDVLQDRRLSFEGGIATLAGWAIVAISVSVVALVVRYLLSKRGTRVAKRDVGCAPMLSASVLTLAYGKRALLHNASLALHPGEIVGLIAPNGRGKTTLLEALVGLNSVRRSGTVIANDTPLIRTAAFRNQVLYVPCDAALLYPNLTAADHIKMAASLWPDKVETKKLIALCQLEGYLNRPVRTYSSGMKQQLALAVAYCTGVRYLLLDEPMNALDPGNVSLNSYILKRLASHGMGVLFSSHILSNVDELCGAMVAIEGAGADPHLVRHDLIPDGPTARELYDAAFGTSGPQLHARPHVKVE